jgi:hypothetical protein
MIFIVSDAVENMRDDTIPNTATLAASSTPDTARTNVGMPLETP